jgi:hypothetical protein
VEAGMADTECGKVIEKWTSYILLVQQEIPNPDIASKGNYYWALYWPESQERSKGLRQ